MSGQDNASFSESLSPASSSSFVPTAKYNPDLSQTPERISPQHDAEKQSLYQVPFLDEKKRPSYMQAWPRSKRHEADNNELYTEDYWFSIQEKMNGQSGHQTLRHYSSKHEASMVETNRRWSPETSHSLQTRQYPRPLLDYVKNEWQNFSDSDSEPSSPTFSDRDFPNLAQIVSAPRFRRCVLVFLVLSILLNFAWGNWIWFVEPARQENKILRNSLRGTIKDGQTLFGNNMAPTFLGMVQMKKLDRGLVPQKGNKKRLIIIGDVHGCHDELLNLLSELSFNPQSDHIIFTGDLVSKGPSSAAVIDLAIKFRASCVRGNHEDRILLAHRDMVSHPLTLQGLTEESIRLPPGPGGPRNVSQPHDNLDEESFMRGKFTDRNLAASLSQKQIDYLASCPVILQVGDVRKMGKVNVVHAGLVPGVDLHRQDPVGVMRMRTIDLKTHVPSRDSAGTPWTKLWNKYQSLIARKHRSTVIYGHDSRRGLQIAKYSKGLDTGCVKGGKLTALVVEVGAKKQKIVSVNCKDYRPRKKVKSEGVNGLGAA